MMWIREIIAMPFSLRQKRLVKNRDHLTRLNFVAKIVEAGGDREAAGLIHDKLSDWIYIREFTPHPDDDLENIYGIAEEELDEDIILEILNKIDVKLPSAERLMAFGRIDTPIRLARLIKTARSESE